MKIFLRTQALLGVMLLQTGCLVITNTDDFTFGEAPGSDTGSPGTETATATGSDTTVAPLPSDTAPAATEASSDTGTNIQTDTSLPCPTDDTACQPTTETDTPTDTVTEIPGATEGSDSLSTDTPTATATSVPASDTALPTDTAPLCEGWTDKDHNLCWEDPYDPNTKRWSIAQTYCEQKGDGWRLPTLIELRMLIRGCSSTEFGNGSFDVEEDCLVIDDTPWDDSRVNCSNCSRGEGPGRGCYWDAALSPDITCDPVDTETKLEFWSSNRVPSYDRSIFFIWTVDFFNGEVDVRGDMSAAFNYARCVKSLR